MTRIRAPGISGGAAETIIFVFMVLYMAVVVGFAGYVLWIAYTVKLGEFDKVAIGAIIAVFGTALTAIGALYTANRQSSTAREVEELRRLTAREMEAVRGQITADLETMKAQSAESLERLRTFLAVGRNAYHELFGAAIKYYYALRSIWTSRKWDDKLLADAEEFMTTALRQVIYVNSDFRQEWVAYWQAVQHIPTLARELEPDSDKRAMVIPELVAQKAGAEGIDLRERLANLEESAKKALEREIVPQRSRVANEPRPIGPIRPTHLDSWS